MWGWMLNNSFLLYAPCCSMCCCVVFVFKQKTAYEMRISDWSSDVCSSDLILLNSVSEAFPRGLANRSDTVGRYLLDHMTGLGAMGTYPGFDDRYYRGR